MMAACVAHSFAFNASKHTNFDDDIANYKNQRVAIMAIWMFSASLTHMPNYDVSGLRQFVV